MNNQSRWQAQSTYVGVASRFLKGGLKGLMPVWWEQICCPTRTGEEEEGTDALRRGRWTGSHGSLWCLVWVTDRIDLQFRRITLVLDSQDGDRPEDQLEGRFNDHTVIMMVEQSKPWTWHRCSIRMESEDGAYRISWGTGCGKRKTWVKGDCLDCGLSTKGYNVFRFEKIGHGFLIGLN